VKTSRLLVGVTRTQRVQEKIRGTRKENLLLKKLDGLERKKQKIEEDRVTNCQQRLGNLHLCPKRTEGG